MFFFTENKTLSVSDFVALLRVRLLKKLNRVNSKWFLSLRNVALSFSNENKHVITLRTEKGGELCFSHESFIPCGELIILVRDKSSMKSLVKTLSPQGQGSAIFSFLKDIFSLIYSILP